MLYTVKRKESSSMNDKKNKTVAFRVDDDEFDLINKLVAMVRKRNKYMDKSKVLRELIGLDHPAFVTNEDRNFLFSALKTPPAQIAITRFYSEPSIPKFQIIAKELNLPESVVFDIILALENDLPLDKHPAHLVELVKRALINGDSEPLAAQG